MYTPTLSPTDFYQQQGYYLASEVYTPEDIARIRQLIERHEADGGWAAAPNSNDHLTTDIYERIPGLAEIIFNDRYLAVIAELFGPDPIILAEPAIHKSRYYFWHKDSTFIDEQAEAYHWQDDFAASMTVLYLQDNHPDYGGGITLVPGTHHDPDFYHRIAHMSLLERGLLKAKKIAGISHFDRMERHPDKVAIPSKAGDVLILDMRLDHKGTPAKKPSPHTKYGIMNIACRGEATAQSLRRTLRNRPSAYYNDYLAGQPLQTPALEAVSGRKGVKVWL
ncbi:phytanoyl-CoA dioxygenase PhyH [Neolewinella xylanilytica]|uniref:Phytanoyl-CoA dioxygenase PhyH n=1 Tax=Neolewinella xylanilytica TaxID=1514080 RepID=A0A2S6I044_9BACT|nr:phytanoyl-CoA dioxygenase family protein [Neolewinella xylanilytica]PPK84228.1 phytanoyl-CoA dioxygenase PhyH [Neolewinella xylanilytica]